MSREALAIYKKMPDGGQPNAAGTMAILADVLVRERKFDEADALIDPRSLSSSQPDRDSAALLRSLGDGEAVRGRWRPAADRFALLMKLDPPDGPEEITLDHSRYAPALIESGDLDAYERYRQGAVAHFAQTRDPIDAGRIIKLSLLRPADPKLLESLKPLSEIARVTDAERGTPTPWAYLSFALLEYRRGEYAKSVEWCGKTLAYGPYIGAGQRDATAHVLLAMSFSQMHRNDEARLELDKGRESIEAEFEQGTEFCGEGFWFDWVIPRILLREADRLIRVPITTQPASTKQLPSGLPLKAA